MIFLMRNYCFERIKFNLKKILKLKFQYYFRFLKCIHDDMK